MQFFSKLMKHTDVMLGIGLLLVVSMLILPLPHWAVDLGLVLAIAGSVMILLTSVNITDPLQFSVFPSLLVVSTLFRLALSIAATKLILGTGQAGHVIETFGNFVMGGDFVVGFVAFLILVIVQFVVITNGAGRVSEVVARFTLDAMPGKQMAIDADLAAGMIDEETAKDRRLKVKQEADFYGAMDGASKFVKGDAVASILIIVINIIGGFAVGLFKGQSDPMTILKTYALLSVGEGLTSQMPALLISSASGLLVTRAGQDRSMAGQVATQFFNQPKAIGVASVAIALFGFIPGFPATLFMGAGALMFLLYRFLTANPNFSKVFDPPKEAPKRAEEPPAPTGPEAVLPLLAVDPIEIEIGYGLTKLADVKVGGDMSERIASTRKQIASELGFIMPTVRIRDSIQLSNSEYVLKIRGEEVGASEVMPDLFLAVNPGSAIESIPGVPTKDPVFGLDALWIESDQRELAERVGYTVIEPSAVITTHLAELVKTHAPELISRQDVQVLIEEARKLNAAAVGELIPEILGVSDVQKVLQHLLRERIPIRDMVTIIETLADFAPKTKDVEQLGEIVRSAISRTITRQYLDPENKLCCLTLDPALERKLADKVNVTSMGNALVLDSILQAELVQSLKSEYERATMMGHQPVLLCGSQVRLPIRRFLDRHLPNLAVLAYSEISSKADVEFVGQIAA
ncbi:MAG: flagellar biosynthesis protein FlhA [Fimbriimonadales bacterium]|jgi:flagellar biosynthesis protein FlhA|nr:flagellar biosynthesis protein FlhA [Fimbriimonadales bacterium]